MNNKINKKFKFVEQVQVDNFSRHRQYAKGFIPKRVEDPDKMRDYEVIRGYFRKNRISYILSKIRFLTIEISRTYGNEREALKDTLNDKFKNAGSLPDAITLLISIFLLEFTLRLLRFFYLHMPSEKEMPRKSIMLEGHNYILFDYKEYLEINFRDIWRPAVVCIPGESIRASIKNLIDFEIRIAFALLENADPKIFSGDYDVNIKYTLKSKTQRLDGNFLVPLNYQNENIEYNKHSLWLDFKINPGQFLEGDIEFTLSAEYQLRPFAKAAALPVNTPAIAWGAPRFVKNKLPGQTKKILLLSLETMTDPLFISENYGIPTEHLFSFLNDKEWRRYRRSYSQSDGTLGAAGSFFTGLTPLQHGLFDYGSPFYTKYSKSWNSNIVTLAQKLKTRGFSTNSISVRVFSGYFGCGRGFDYHFPCYTLHESDCADFDWFYQSWNNDINNDALVFMHLNKTHKPYTKCNRRTNKIYPIEDLTDSSSPLEKYVKQMYELDMQIKIIINFLKFTNQYENTLIICVGDHGGAYAWKKRQAYDLYEDRIRVPLWVKEANWSGSLPLDTGHPIDSTIFAFHGILKALDIQPPEYFEGLAHLSSEFANVAISETATAPAKQDYVLSLTDYAHKYIRFMKIDWERNIIISTEKELLQPYIYASKDYGLSMDCSSEHPGKFKKMKKLADMHIESSLEFRRRYPLED